jgi:hypothetical protein
MSKSFARFTSLLFHPLIIPFYMALLVVYAHPQHFSDTKVMHTDVRLMYFFGIMVLFPVFSLFLMKKLEIISDLNSEDGKERFIPMIAIGTFWLWAYVMFKEGALYATASYYPLGLSILGCIISLFILFPFNFTSRIAWHVVGMGSLLSLLFNIFSTSYYNVSFRINFSCSSSGLGNKCSS